MPPTQMPSSCYWSRRQEEGYSAVCMHPDDSQETGFDATQWGMHSPKLNGPVEGVLALCFPLIKVIFAIVCD
jgi:hypothetical protein